MYGEGREAHSERVQTRRFIPTWTASNFLRKPSLMLSCNRWLKTISAVRVSWPYLLVRILKYEIEAMKDRSNADGELYHGKVSTDARPAYFENDEVSKEHRT